MGVEFNPVASKLVSLYLALKKYSWVLNLGRLGCFSEDDLVRLCLGLPALKATQEFAK